MAEKLTEAQRCGLIELQAACDEMIKYGGSGWVRTYALCGTPEVRSARTIRSLIAIGFAEGEKDKGHAQQQWMWRITPAGRAALSTQTPETEP